MEYLKPVFREQIDTLVLGCTHYPLLKPLLHEVAGPAIQLVGFGCSDGRADRAGAGEIGPLPICGAVYQTTGTTLPDIPFAFPDHRLSVFYWGRSLAHLQQVKWG